MFMSVKDELFKIIREEVEVSKSRSPAPELLCILYGDKYFLGRLDMNFLIVYNIEYSHGLEPILNNVVDEIRNEEIKRVSIGDYVDYHAMPHFLRNGNYSRKFVYIDDDEILQGHFEIIDDRLMRLN